MQTDSYIEQINKVLLYSTGNYIQYPVINHNGKEFEKKCRFPWWLRGKESACQCRRHRFNPWSRKMPHAAEQLPQLLSLCSRAWELQLLKPAHLRAGVPQEKALQREAHTQKLEKSLHDNKHPTQPK